jgi:hypothetical protein
VETWQNRDPAKAYALFRQFIVDWDQQDKLTDDILMCFLAGYPEQMRLFLPDGMSI